LAELLGLTQSEMLAQYDFVNVLDRWPGKSFIGDNFPMAEARLAAKKLIPTLQGRTVVLLGNNVARAFGVSKFAYLQRYRYQEGEVTAPTVVVIPHVSGIVRYWNRPENREVARKFLRELSS
jgi:hypothetical protein